MSRYVASQKGFSLVKMLVALLVVAGIALYFMPQIGGDTFTVINQLSDRAKGIGNLLGSKFRLLTNTIGATTEGLSVRFSDQLAGILDKLHLKGLAKELKSVKEEWQKDMQMLIGASKSRGFDMSSTMQSYNEYEAGTRSWRRVETQYWDDMRKQTQQAIEKSFKNFLMRPVGCSDFTVELKKIWEIGAAFNEDTFDGYTRAKELSQDLYNPRSLDFVPLVLEWLNIAGLYVPPSNNDWFIQQLRRAIEPQNGPTSYPQIIQQIDGQASSNPVYCIIANIVIAEIYLNYDLMNGAIERYDEAIRSLYAIANRIDQGSPYSYQALGTHMTLGLLNERLCSNADLALKEFKDVVAIARRLNLPCNQYNTAHYHLAIMNLQIRERATILPQFVPAPIANTQTVSQLLPAATPTPAPNQATPTPALVSSTTTTISTSTTTNTYRSDSNVVKGTVPAGGGRALVEVPTAEVIPPASEREERPVGVTAVVVTPVVTPTPLTPTYAEGEVVKGTIAPGELRRAERDIRLRPRAELGQTVKMQTFSIEQLYDLSRIPEDAVREFETYLKCENEGEEVVVARYVLNKYLGK